MLWSIYCGVFSLLSDLPGPKVLCMTRSALIMCLQYLNRMLQYFLVSLCFQKSHVHVTFRFRGVTGSIQEIHWVLNWFAQCRWYTKCRHTEGGLSCTLDLVQKLCVHELSPDAGSVENSCTLIKCAWIFHCIGGKFMHTYFEAQISISSTIVPVPPLLFQGHQNSNNNHLNNWLGSHCTWAATSTSP